ARPGGAGGPAAGVHRPGAVPQPDGAPRDAHRGPQPAAPGGVGAGREEPLLPALDQRGPGVQPRPAHLLGVRGVSVRRLTEPRTHLRPAEYPEFLAYRDAIRHAYWLHTEYNLTDDIHDFRTRAT